MVPFQFVSVCPLRVTVASSARSLLYVEVLLFQALMLEEAPAVVELTAVRRAPRLMSMVLTVAFSRLSRMRRLVLMTPDGSTTTLSRLAAVVSQVARAEV